MLTFTPLSGAAKSERTNPLASLQVDDTAFDWQLSAMAQVLSSFLSSLPTLTLESLSITVSRKDWPGEIEGIPMARIFTLVHLCEGCVPSRRRFGSACCTGSSRARRRKSRGSITCSTKSFLLTLKGEGLDAIAGCRGSH